MAAPYPDGSIEARLQPFAEAVGSLCQVWADLEESATELFAVVAKLPAGGVTPVMLAQLDFRDMLAAVKVGVVAARYEPELIRIIHESIDYIDNQLRSRRNRLVHDRWALAPDDISIWRLQRTSRVVRPQANKLAVQGTIATVEQVEEIQFVTFEVAQHSQYLIDIGVHIDFSDEFPLQPLLDTPPQRRLLPLPPETPNPSDKKPPKRPRPPRSSRGKSQN